MASVEPVKEKKKNKLRSRFLMTQCSSLDHGSSSASVAANQCTEREESRTSPSSSGSSRIRKMLFRRSRSEDRMRNIRIKENGAPQTTPGNRTRFPFSTALVSDGAVSLVAHPNHLMPQSPPPPYEGDLEREADAVGTRLIISSTSPPSYSEAVGQTNSNSSCEVSHIHWTDPGGHDLYCMCHECQARYLTADDEEPENSTEDNCADAVFPIETHFLMQEVLADGMAFCCLM